MLAARRARVGACCEMVVAPSSPAHGFMTQVVGPTPEVIKLIPPLMLGRRESHPPPRLLDGIGDVLETASKGSGSHVRTSARTMIKQAVLCSSLKVRSARLVISVRVCAELGRLR